MADLLRFLTPATGGCAKFVFLSRKVLGSKDASYFNANANTLTQVDFVLDFLKNIHILTKHIWYTLL